MTDRFIQFIDVEGFKNRFRENKAEALKILGGLVLDFDNIGLKVYPDRPDEESKRLFIHQIVDGFIVVHEIGFADLLEPLAMTVVLMRRTLLRGGCLKAGIARGEFGDYNYHGIKLDKYGRIPIGRGFLVPSSVFGEGAFRAYELSTNVRGPVIAVPAEWSDELTAKEFRIKRCKTCACVDWIHSSPRAVTEIEEKLGCPPSDTEQRLRQYIDKFSANLKDNWKDSATALIEGY